MGRKIKVISLLLVCLAYGTGALALNPQPEPPGVAMPTQQQSPQMTTSGNTSHGIILQSKQPTMDNSSKLMNKSVQIAYHFFVRYLALSSVFARPIIMRT